MKIIKESFPPIANKKARILILGTMPGEESLKKQEYYGHPRNTFWKIMANLFEFENVETYKARTKKLIVNKIALWDVMQSCERQGSLDSAIIDNTIAENDFKSFYHHHPHISHVFFNGTKAEKEYIKRVLPGLPIEKKGTRYTRLPSTSPAMARLSFNEKLLEWSKIRKELEQTIQQGALRATG